MKIKKRTKIILSVLLFTTLTMGFLADRNIIQIYGGLTELVDVSQFNPSSDPIMISGVNILSYDGESFIADQTVYIKNGLIVSINKPPTGFDNYHPINGQGKYLIPGLTDAHAHLFKSPNDLLLYVANGVTQIRELIGEPDHLAWRNEIREGRIGPDMFVATPRIGSFGFIEGWLMEWTQGYMNLTNAMQAETAVKKFHQQGYDAVKIYSQINHETYLSVTKTAHDLGMKVVGHVPWDLQLGDIYSSHDSIGHLEELMNALNREFGDYNADTSEEFLAYVEQRSPVIAEQLFNNDIAVSTTLWLIESMIRQKLDLHQVLTEVELEFENPGISEWSKMTPRGLGWLPEVNRYKWPDDWGQERRSRSTIYWTTYASACQIILKHLIKQQVKIIAGTDTNIPPVVAGFALHDELISLNKAGMTPSQALKSATSEPANWLDNNTGIVAIGRTANLVLLNQNPLVDISHTKNINSVILHGRLLDREMLDQMLSDVKEANDSSRKEDISQYLH